MYRSVMCVLHYASTLELGAHFQADGPIRAPHPIIAISGLTRPVADDRYWLLSEESRITRVHPSDSEGTGTQNPAIRTTVSEDSCRMAVVPGTSSFQSLPQVYVLMALTWSLCASWVHRLRLDSGLTVPEEVLRIQMSASW